MPELLTEYRSQMLSQTVQHPIMYVIYVHFLRWLIVFFVLNFTFKVLYCKVSSSHLNNISSLLVRLGWLKMEACSVKRVASTCIEFCVYICQLLSFVMISYFQCRSSVMLCWVKSLNPLKFNGLLYWWNLINSCGSVSPAINEGKEVGLLPHNIQKCNIQLLSRKKTSVSNDIIYGFC
jgi:hypothetical protein